MIKVIEVLTDTNIGGAGIWLLNFLKAYDRGEIDMSVILPYGSMLKDKINELDVRVIEVEGIADCSFSKDGVKNLDLVLKEEAPDIIHTHASLSARIAAKRNGIKVVHTRHCIEDKKRFLKKLIYGVINNSLSDRVIGVSKAVCRNLEEDGIRRSKLRLVYNGIFPLEEITDEKKTEVKRKYNIPDGVPVVGIIARLEPVKNHEMFLDAAKVVSTICPDVVFVVVGSGSLEKYLKEKVIRDETEGKVIFTGHIDDVNDIMNVVDIHVLTSQKEALSISLIEAMSIDKPVVATNSGGPAEVIHDRVNGLLVGIDDDVNLTMAIVKLLQNSELRRKMGREGSRIVREKFLALNMARDIEKIYDEL